MATAPTPKPATAAEVRAWRKRTGHSIATAAELFGVHTRTFSRWLSGDFQSPRYLGDVFRGK